MGEYIILGIIQGLTEFLPVSSSGHLVVMKNILGINSGGIVLEIVLHLGTLLATIIFFFKDILKIIRLPSWLFLILLATLITAVFGISGKDFFERLFNQPKYVALGLIFTGSLLIWSKKFMWGKKDTPKIKDTIIFGIAQGVAIIPGVSRSGITICSLLVRGMKKECAFRFSFLASIFAVLGATLLKAKEIGFALKGDTLLNLTVGFMASFLTGIFALWLLKKVISKTRLHYFGYYCILLAIVILLVAR